VERPKRIVYSQGLLTEAQPVANSPSDPFDPCREWLGIDRADLAHPRRILGLVPSESDPIIVLRACEARLSLLKGLAAGPHHAARESLILRVEQAREAVLSEIAAATDRGRPAPTSSGFAMPPAPRRPGADRPIDDAATVVFAEHPGGISAEAFPPAAPAVKIRTVRPVHRRGNGAAIWISVLAMLGSVAAGVAFIWWQAQQQEHRLAAKHDHVRHGEPNTGESAILHHKGAHKPLPADAPISSSPSPTPTRSMAADAPNAIAERRPRPAAVTPASKPAPIPDPPTAPPAIPQPGEPMDSGTDPQPAASMVAEETTASDAAASDEGTMVDPRPEEEDPADEAVDGELAQAHEALREGDFDTADAVLASALEGARGIPAKQRIADWKVLAQYAREYAGFRAKALTDVKPGNEFDVHGKKVAVVEIDDKKFIYRFQGRNKTTPRDKIPSAILLEIVTTWFDDRPANHLFLGAYHATKPEPDLAKARDHWDLAEKGGINAAPLLGLLDDPVLLDCVATPSTEPADE
jgi:hypothetical protein